MTEEQKKAMTLRRLGLHIRTQRISRGLTQAELADRLGRTVEFVIKLEKGYYEPNILEYVEIGGALDDTLDHFVW